MAESQSRFGIVQNEPSRTALMAAAARAAHLIVDDEPLIFRDSQAYALLGEHAEEFVAYHRLHGTHPVLAGARAAVLTRSRYTEDKLAESGISQYVILGAGLDSFAHRNTDRELRIFEVDHPATQEWKRQRLPHPPGLTYIPADLEVEPLALTTDQTEKAFVSWLGVTMYLSSEAIEKTLAAMATFATGTELVVEHMLPEDLRDAAGQAYAEAVMPVAAEHGEPWLSLLSPTDMAVLLDKYGFEVIAHKSQREAIDPGLWNRTDALRPAHLSALTHARLSRY